MPTTAGGRRNSIEGYVRTSGESNGAIGDFADSPVIVFEAGTCLEYDSVAVSPVAAVELTPDDLRDIETAALKISVQGARYSEAAQRMINR